MRRPLCGQGTWEHEGATHTTSLSSALVFVLCALGPHPRPSMQTHTHAHQYLAAQDAITKSVEEFNQKQVCDPSRARVFSWSSLSLSLALPAQD